MYLCRMTYLLLQPVPNHLYFCATSQLSAHRYQSVIDDVNISYCPWLFTGWNGLSGNDEWDRFARFRFRHVIFLPVRSLHPPCGHDNEIVTAMAIPFCTESFLWLVHVYQSSMHGHGVEDLPLMIGTVCYIVRHVICL
jgi:hypothetical protein